MLDGDRVLLMGLQGPDDPHRWYHFPGGGIEADESAEEAVVRELFEETGIAGKCAAELVRVATGGMEHRYFLIECDDFTIGECTGPEAERQHEVGFAAEWFDVRDLQSLSLWPRAAAEHLAQYIEDRTLSSPAPEVEDYRMSWEGTALTGPSLRLSARIVLFINGQLAVMKRWRAESGSYATLPGGGLEPGETLEETAVREAREELGVDIEVLGRLAVVDFATALATQTYFWCATDATELGTGTGDEFTSAERQASRGTYEPALVDLDQLETIGIRPTWLIDELPTWIQDPTPARPDRFFEL